MAHHDVEIQQINGDWVVTCTCRARFLKRSKSDCMEWKFFHLKQIEQVRASLTRTTPSLKTSHKHYTEMAQTDPLEQNRVLWQALADELAPRLGGDSSADVPLFDVPDK